MYLLIHRTLFCFILALFVIFKYIYIYRERKREDGEQGHVYISHSFLLLFSETAPAAAAVNSSQIIFPLQSAMIKARGSTCTSYEVLIGFARGMVNLLWVIMIMSMKK